jgi:hypothetical protein
MTRLVRFLAHDLGVEGFRFSRADVYAGLALVSCIVAIWLLLAVAS